MLRLKLVLMVLILSFGVSAYAYKDGDFQVWNTDAQELKINKDYKITSEEEFRWGNGAREFYYQHYDLGLTRTLNKYWNVSGGYRHVLSLNKGKWKVENEPYMAAALSWDMAGFKLEDRSRLEYRHFDYKADAWRYRNKFTVKLPWKFTGLNIQPFLSDEGFARFEKINQFGENRFYAGLAMDLTKDIKAEVYYLLDSAKNDKKQWIASNVLGTKIKIAF
jgi:hypothetical protein